LMSSIWYCSGPLRAEFVQVCPDIVNSVSRGRAGPLSGIFRYWS